ncbi:hypothetical protein [Brenneria roseae]|uniref:hypothetical protein n=1 Tax=Brenneria roseae TaxID=1509241 RepID=UPI00109E3531|nr:hypothetical protein [Brenneria roseae]
MFMPFIFQMAAALAISLIPVMVWLMAMIDCKARHPLNYNRVPQGKIGIAPLRPYNARQLPLPAGDEPCALQAEVHNKYDPSS